MAELTPEQKAVLQASSSNVGTRPPVYNVAAADAATKASEAGPPPAIPGMYGDSPGAKAARFVGGALADTGRAIRGIVRDIQQKYKEGIAMTPQGPARVPQEPEAIPVSAGMPPAPPTQVVGPKSFPSHGTAPVVPSTAPPEKQALDLSRATPPQQPLPSNIGPTRAELLQMEIDAPRPAVVDRLVRPYFSDLSERTAALRATLAKGAEARTDLPPSVVPAESTPAPEAPKFEHPWNREKTAEGVMPLQGVDPEVHKHLTALGLTGEDYFDAVEAMRGGWDPRGYRTDLTPKERQGMMYDMRTADPGYMDRRRAEWDRSPEARERALDFRRNAGRVVGRTFVGRRSGFTDNLQGGDQTAFNASEDARWNAERDREQAALIEQGRQSGRLSDRQAEQQIAALNARVTERGHNIGLMSDREKLSSAQRMQNLELTADEIKQDKALDAELALAVQKGDMEAVQKYNEAKLQLRLKAMDLRSEEWRTGRSAQAAEYGARESAGATKAVHGDRDQLSVRDLAELHSQEVRETRKENAEREKNGLAPLPIEENFNRWRKGRFSDEDPTAAAPIKKSTADHDKAFGL